MVRWFSVVVTLLLLCSGCSQSKKPDGTDGDKPANVKAPIPFRDSTDGRWQLMVAEKGFENPFLLIQIEGKKDATKVQVVDVFKSLPLKPTVASAVVDGEAVRIEFTAKEMPISFEGTFEDGEVVGNIAMNPVTIMPARLIATEAKSLKDAQPSSMLLQDGLRQAVASEKPDVTILEFARKHPDSPLALDAYEILIMNSGRAKLTQEKLEEIADEYVKRATRWGARLEPLARMKVGMGLLQARQFPEMALKSFEDVEKQLNDPKHPLQTAIDSGKSLANQIITAENRHKKVDAAGRKIDSEVEEERQAAYDELASLVKEDEFDPMILYHLARAAKKAKRTDDAIEWYSRLVAFPSLEGELQVLLAQEEKNPPPPGETLKALWKEKHGDTEGLNAHLDAVYREKLFTFATEKVPPRTEDGGTQNVLLELFTGSNCPPCVSADLATSGLEHVFDRKEVIVLRYHQHIGHDQLVNEDAEVRFMSYKLKGTPMLLLNGQMVGNVGGSLEAAPFYYKQLRDIVSKKLEEKTDVRIALSADAKDGVLHLSAKATGLPKENAESLRLRMVLAEEEIAFAASNGIRIHEMIVRAMPGTPDGVDGATDGELSFETDLKLSDFRQKLVDYLEGYEQQNNISFKQKPLALEKLVFVAFVQSEKEDQAVLQSAAVPVTGTVEYASQGKASATPSAASEADTAATAEKPDDEEKPAEPKKDDDAKKSE